MNNYFKTYMPTLAATALSFLVVLPAYANITLPNNRWEMMTVPVDASSTSVQSLFGDDLPSNEYGQSWALFRFDASQQAYVQPSLSDTLKQGDGFWIIQTTGNSVVIDLPNNLAEGPSNDSLPCASVNGCYSKKLPASTASGSRWSLNGAPYSSPINVYDIRLTSSNDQCSLGYDLEESVQEGFLTSSQWAYNSTTGEYELLTDSVTLNPWQGFWIATAQQSEQVSLYMLLPNPNSN